MILGSHLTDTWTLHPNRPAYTHSSTGATRIDRIYMSRDLMTRKTGIEILPAAFTDHSAVVLRLTLGETGARRDRVRWKLDPDMLLDADLLSHLRQQWNRWKMRKPCYPNVNIWWDRYVKRQLQQYLIKWGADRRREHEAVEDHLYHCIYDIKQSDIP